MKHTKRFYLFVSILILTFLLTLTSCRPETVIYNVNTMHTATSFGFTDNGEAYVNVSYTGYHSTKKATIDIKIEKQGFLFFWNTVAEEKLTVEDEDYQNERFYPIAENGNYRCTVTYTVSGTGEDDVIVFKDEKTYNKDVSYTDTAETTESSVTETTSTETTTTESTTTETTTTEIITTEPPESEEEKALRLRYEAAVEALNDYIANGANDSETLKYLYNEFSALGDYEDSEMYFSRFTALPDMLTDIVLTTIDSNGNTKEKKVGGYTYNQNGQITSAFGEDMRKLYSISDEYMHHFTYDEEGKLLVIDVLYTKNDKTYREAKLYAEYDENGKLIRLAEEAYEISDPPFGTIVYSATNTRTYSIGENGKPIFIDIKNPSYPSSIGLIPSSAKKTYSSSYTDSGDLIRTEAKTSLSGLSAHLYTDKYQETETWYYENKYDENGNLIQVVENWDFHSVYEYYVYDGNKDAAGGFVNGLPSYFYSYPSYKLNTTERKKNTKITKNFTYDENGRLISAEIIDHSKPNTEQYLTYEYETLYFYQG